MSGSNDTPLRPADARDTRPDVTPEVQAAAQRALLLKLVRAGFLILFMTMAVLSLLDIAPENPTTDAFLGLGLQEGWLLTLITAVGVGGLVGVIDWLTPHKKISTLAAVFLGLLGSMLAAVAVGVVIDLLAQLYDLSQGSRPSPLVLTLKVLVGICLAYLAIITVLQTQDDFRLVIPYVEFAKERRGTRPILLDSSALIDARLLGVSRTGVLQAPIVIPRFVIGELQRLADLGDDLKRGRGRRGLDIIAQLQREPELDVSIDETPVDAKAVDSQLVQLARTMSGVIATTDTGLERVAKISGVSVLNINALAASLKPELVPGEPISVRVIRAGEQPGQGVGFLADGTMVVVEDGARRIDEMVDARVTSSLQTSAGRLIFAAPSDDELPPAPEPPPADVDEDEPLDEPPNEVTEPANGPVRKPPRGSKRNPRR